MISHFPAPYEDELFWSVIARYHKRTLAVNPTETFKVLCRENDEVAQFNFKKIHSKLKHLEYISLDEILNNNTAYNYYMFFKNNQEKEELLRKIIDGEIYFDFVNTNLRFCLQCLNDDLENKGEAYWRHFHQIPSVFTCLRHNALLQESTVSYKKTKPVAANQRNCMPLPHKTISRKAYLMLHRLTVESEYIFLNKIQYDHTKLQLFIAHSLKSKGLINYYGMLKKESLLHQLIKVFGVEFFHYIKMNLDQFIENINATFGHSGVRSYLSSTQLLILIILMSGSVKKFIVEMNGFSPKERKCLVCGKSILRIQLYPDLKTNKCIMNVRCTCGVTQDSIMGDRYVTHNSLNISFNNKDQRLDYIYNCIFVKGLNLGRLSWKMNIDDIQIEHQLSECLVTKQEEKSITQKYKAEWKSLSDSKTPIEELKIINYPAYIWLNTYAHEYLEMFKYPDLNSSSINKEIWRKRDKMIKETLRKSLLLDRLSGERARTIIRFNYRYGQNLRLKWQAEISYLPETKEFIDKLERLQEGLSSYWY